ncbi:Sodium/proton antiporter nhaB [Raoultella terrigena]|uniref:Sodium/proton antiporter nhaB n=1 Tax=Raoultella terrigena TaxID=577 RepID=A0A4U9CVK8_RAOTE|nr:Sodium/proton antiporter nhaB [Raoultella terrigena]
MRKVLQDYDDRSRQQRSRQDRLRLIAQGIIGIWLITALALHLGEVGLIGLVGDRSGDHLLRRDRRARYR